MLANVGGYCYGLLLVSLSHLKSVDHWLSMYLLAFHSDDSSSNPAVINFIF